MARTVRSLACLALLLATTGFAFIPGKGILHGVVTDGSGAPETDLTAVVTLLEGQYSFEGSQELTGTGEFVLGPPVGVYLVELEDSSGDVVDYRTGVHVFPDITTFLFFTVDLPTVCQTNLGHGSAGGMTLTLCGDDLTAAGNLATLNVYNATPGSVVHMPIGLAAVPTPFKGGTLVPVPWLVLLSMSTSTFGTVELPVPGSAGPQVTLFMQVVDSNGPTFRFSNAIEVVLGI